MPLSEIIRQALSSLGANRLRSWLTIMGVAVGVFSIIAVMTTVDALDRSVESGLASLGANTFQIQKYPATVFGRGHRRNLYVNRPDISWRQAQEFRRNMEGKARTVGLSISSQGNRARYRNRTTNPDVTLVGGDEHFAAANGLGLAFGRNLTDNDVRYARNAALLGADLARALFPGSENPIGEPVRIAGKVYRVAGVFTRKGAAFGQSQDNFMLIPVTRYLSHVNEKGSLSITVEARSREEYPKTLDLAVGAMRLARGLGIREANDFEIRTNESLVESFRDIERAISVGAFIISFMALLTAGVGIMNIMLVSVTERTREIGIRKSIGAPKSSILRQFLLEAILLSLVGGLFGAAAGTGAGNLVALNLQLPPTVPYLWVAVSMAVCSAIGVGFGIFPAWKAANLDPVEALRGK
ncbi:ABC transporter permease [Chlorobium sp. N1]|uniref:ABC transporter permease n=1 Tax=Chlorobium sp. N1 TaxID=2491138 RepID=UPI00103C1C22|nr:ABC transporter permease [Chlorobium sp. N1]TCD48516.1 FtsX-like permease family protein [Chlorobium sp. N1]